MPSAIFERVSTELDFPKEERETLAFWKEQRIFQKSLEARKDAPPFVFYEGPPTANGLPHTGHVLTRVIKDLFPRYKTMRGFRVPRKAGWDTHGLPVEVEVEKELHIHGKAAIEQYGVEPFIQKCVESVFRYTSEWEHLTERVGFWVDLPDAYVTYHKSYVESVWWALSELFKKGLLYQGHKVVWWWAQGGTALSSGEVGLGYREVDDPSVFVGFPLKEPIDGQDAALLVWTTTPWTLPSNMYAAVRSSFEYALVKDDEGRCFVLARDLVPPLAKKLKGGLEVLREMKGADLVGREYAPPFAIYESERAAWDKLGVPLWRVCDAAFVTLDTGTGIVHVAPAFGEDDYELHRQVKPGTTPAAPLCAVAPDGSFKAEMGRAYEGRWVKDCDKDIIRELRDGGRLVHSETYRHDYPFCWRSDQDPLIQYARPAWYVKTTAKKDEAIQNNRAVQWLPEHIKEGRFGDFLAHNVDWALSRERYWGTPLNVWRCSADPDKHQHAPASVSEIEKRNPSAFEHFHAARKTDPTLSEHLIVHKPWIDAVVFPCPACGAEMRRVPEVIDCWFDSGCMPFAQWGFPHQGRDEFKRAFPADFISEAIDQTRGWFYSLLMIATLIFDDATAKKYDLGILPYPLPYKTCIVLGHVSDREGKKESKSKGNYTPPEIILDAVKMDFAVLSHEQAHALHGKVLPAVEAGWVVLPKEDREGFDLPEPVAGKDPVVLRASGPNGTLDLKVREAKALPRRVVLLADADRAALGLAWTQTPDVKPVEVPRLSAFERVTLEDTMTPPPGADAFRWFFYAASPPWNATRHSLSNVRSFQKEFLVKLRNVYSFFTIYANIDEFDPWGARGKEPVSLDRRSELDRWVLGELQSTVTQVTQCLDDYDVYGATQLLTALVDGLSNWYVRRSRARFWRSGWDDDKAAAYQTLYEALVTTTKLVAPFVPFTADTMYQNLFRRPARRAGVEVPESVHLLRYPRAEESRFSAALKRTTNLLLADKVKAVRDLVSLGQKVRTEAKIKVRQPLRHAYGIVVDTSLLEGSATDHLKQELNVLEFHAVGLAAAERFVEFRVKPNFRALGQRGLGREAQKLKAVMADMSSAVAADIAGKLLGEAEVSVDGIVLTKSDVDIELIAKEGFAAAGARVGVVVLDTRLDEELLELGLVREFLSRIQAVRKDMGLDYTDRVHLFLRASDQLRSVIEKHREEIMVEVLAEELTFGEHSARDAMDVPFKVESFEGTISLLPAISPAQARTE
jgi:isoleucyl-tRNA synthetase